jgi:TolB-like protein
VIQRPFGAYRGDGPYVFVSYAHDDADAVFPELVWLKEQGFNIWYDEGIGAGTEWRDEIAQAIISSRVFIYFVTPRSTESNNCRKEVHYAVDRQVPVIAVHLQPTELPNGIDLAISDRQAILQHEIGQRASRLKLLERVSAYVGDVRSARIDAGGLRSRRRWISIAGFALASMVALLWYLPIGSPDNSIEQLSMAVLPFEALSEETAAGYFADGLRAEVLVALNGREYCGFTDCKPVHLASGAAADRFSGRRSDPATVAEALGVAYLLEGSVQTREDQARITMELTRGRDSAQVWSKTFERTLDAGFEIQKSLATNIAHLASNEMGFDVDATQAPELSRFAGIDPQALQHFMDAANEYRMNALDGSGSMQLRMQMLNRALEVEPDFELAHLFLGGMYAFRFGLPLADAQKMAHRHISKVQNVEFSEVALEKSAIHVLLDLDYAAAEKLLEQSLRGTPRWEVWQHFWRARVAMREGRREDGLQYLRNSRSFQAGVEQSYFLSQAAWLYSVGGEYQRVLDMTAEGLSLGENGLGRNGNLLQRLGALFLLDRPDEAKPIVAELEQTTPPYMMAAAYAWLGQEDRARRILEERRGKTPMPFQYQFSALAYVALEDTDAAFDAIRLGILDHDEFLIDSLRLSEFWDPLRSDPRFDEMLRLLSSKEMHTAEYLKLHD